MKTLLAIATLASACAPTLPKDPIQRALVRDLAKVVESQDQIGWFIDDIDVQQTLPYAMDSACRIAPAQRTATLAWIDEEMTRQGGPVEVAYERAGKDLSAIDDLLMLHRARILLAKADQWANEGKCPFWLEVDPEFAGRHTFAGHWLVGVESGGRGYVQLEGDQGGFGGGGAGRLLIGYGVNEWWTVIGGVQVGGAGRFTDVRVKERLEVPAILIIGAVPIINRFLAWQYHYDLELGATGYFNQLRGKVQYGGRVGVGIGLMRSRLSDFLPSVTASLAYDVFPAQRGMPAVHQIGVGLRAGLALTL